MDEASREASTIILGGQQADSYILGQQNVSRWWNRRRRRGVNSSEPPPHVNEERPHVNEECPLVNEECPLVNEERPHVNEERSHVNQERPHVNKECSTLATGKHLSRLFSVPSNDAGVGAQSDQRPDLAVRLVFTLTAAV
ncbi:hypothetical protein FOPE_10841 [Fonsecaea pedrosoi]|nr:hypothetical protein FOPE_10841 [Fonsecaea pedrosoi]